MDETPPTPEQRKERILQSLDRERDEPGLVRTLRRQTHFKTSNPPAVDAMGELAGGVLDKSLARAQTTRTS
jgi:hypothetical protein